MHGHKEHNKKKRDEFSETNVHIECQSRSHGKLNSQKTLRVKDAEKI